MVENKYLRLIYSHNIYHGKTIYPLNTKGYPTYIKMHIFETYLITNVSLINSLSAQR